MNVEVIVNGRCLSRRTTGVERYAREILRQLAGQVHSVQPRFKNQGAAGHAWEQFALPWRVPHAAVLWSPANSGPLAVANQVLSLHDLTPLEHPEWYRPAFAHWYRLMLPLLVQRVRQIVTISDYSRKKITERFHLPDHRVTVVPPGVDLQRFHPEVEPIGKRRYILFVGTLEPRKNLPGLLDAWGKIRARYPDIDLAIAGDTGSVFSRASFPADDLQVHWLGYLPDTALRSYYANAEVFVLPSWDEGFGLTVLEAMACGAPVVISRVGALLEAAGNAGVAFDPHQAGSLGEVLEGVLSNTSLRMALREKGLARVKQFTWAAAAEKILQVLRGAYDA